MAFGLWAVSNHPQATVMSNSKYVSSPCSFDFLSLKFAKCCSAMDCEDRFEMHRICRGAELVQPTHPQVVSAYAICK